MADREITFKLRAISDISDVTKNVQALRDYFKQLKMPSDTFKGFDNTFTQIEKKVENVQAKLQAGFKTSGDVNSFKRELADIRQLYASIARDIKGIDVSEVFKGVDSPELTKAKQNLKDFEDALKDLQDINLKNINEQFEIIDAKKFSKVRQEVTELRTALSEGNFDQAARQARDLAKAVNSMKEGDKATAYRSLLERLGLGKDETGKVITDINKIREALKQAFNGDALDNAKTGIEATRIQIENLSTAQVEDLIKRFEELGLVVRTGATQEMPRMQRSVEDTVESSRHLNSELDQFKNRIAYFFGMNNAVHLFQRALRSAYETVKDLDKVMTETAVVTDFSVSDMWAQLPEYTARANELGVTIHDVYEASTLYYQQGLKTNEVMAVTNATLRMARIAGLDAADATDRVTNALRGFNMEITEANANNIADVYSKLAAISASNVDEISTAMTKTASLASSANMEFETTAAFLAQIIETTRESAETAGTALKTVIARFSEVKKLYSEGELLGTDTEGEEIDVNKVSAALRTAGINLNEFLTGSKGLDEVFMELASRWDSLTIVQQRYIATMAAGSRQQSRFIALMSDYARTQELVGAAQNATGASQEQYEKTLDSLETKLNQLKNAWDEFVMGLAKDEAIKWVVDSLTNLLGAVNKLTANLPGLLKTLSRVGIAFGAFKGTSAIFNGLLRTVGTKLGIQMQDAGEKAAPLFAGGFSNALQKLWPQTKTTFENNLSTLFDTGAIKIDLADQILDNYNQGNYSAIKDSLKGITVEGEDAQRALTQLMQVNMSPFEAGLQRISTATSGIGMGLTLIGQLLKSLGLEEAGKVIQTIGVGLTAVGLILPQLIKLGKALGLSFDFIGIHAAKAGAEAAAGGTAATLAWSEFIPIAIAIAALIGVIVLGINNMPEKKIQKMQEHLQEVQEAATEAKNQYDELKSTIESIEEAETAIDDLDKGTREWRDAVLELNQQYLDLINKVPALAPFLRSSGGVLTIDFNDDEVQKVINAVQQDAIERSMQSSLVTQNISRANIDNAREGLVARGYDRPLTQDEKDTYDQIAKALVGDIEAQAYYEREHNITRNGQSDEEYAKALYAAENMYWLGGDLTEKLLNYGDLLLSEGQQLEAQNRALAASIVANTDLDTTEIDNASELLTDEVLENFQSGVDLARDMTKEARDEYEKYWEEWVTSQGGHLINIRNRGGIVYEVDGERKVIRAPGAIEQYNTHLMSEGSTDALEKLASRDLPEALHRALLQSANLVASDLTELSSKNIDLDKIWGELSAEEQKLFEGSQEVFENWINQNAQALRDALDQSVENGFKNFENLDISSGTIQSINNAFEQYQSEYGAATANSFVEQINELTSDENLDASGLLDFINSISDWSKKTVPDTIKEMSDLGIEFGDSEGAIRALISQLIELDRASSKINLEDFKTLLSNSAEALKDLSGRSATDRTFTQDQYEKLLAISPELVTDMVWNGTDWSYIGGSLNSLEAAIRANTDAILSERIEALNEQINIGQAISDSIEKANGGAIVTTSAGGKYTFDQLNDVSRTNTSDLENARRQYLEEIGFNSEEFAQLSGQALAEYFTTQMDQYYGTNGSVLAGNITTRDTYENQQKVAEILNSDQTMTSLQGQANIGLASGENNEYAQAILAKAAAYGVAEQQLEEYNNLLEETGLKTEDDRKKAQDLLNTIAKSAALAKATKDMENYGKAISDNLKTLEEYDEGSREYNDALENMTEQTEHFFGGLELPDNFFDGENLQLLQDALAGSDEAWADFIENVTASQASVTDWGSVIENVIGETQPIIDAVDGTEINVDGTADVSAIIKAMQAAGASAEEVGRYLDELGYAHIDFEAQGSKDMEDVITRAENGTLGSIIATNVRTPGRSGFSSGAGGGGGSGGGGGGGSSKKQTWKNPYDELYNLTEKINEAIRERNHLEDEYDRILKRNTGDTDALYKNSLKQLDVLKKQYEYQKQMLAGRRSQIENIGQQKFETSEGDFKTFDEMDVTKYLKYNFEAGTLEMDWPGVNSITDTEQGKAFEAYHKMMEEWVKDYEDTEDTLLEIEDNMFEIQERSKEDALDMEKRIAEALYNVQQKIIDDYQSLSDTISNSNDRVLSSLQDSIDLSRQIRDNTKTESDIAKKEARLAYLRRDTSGANELEARQLEQELADARESYGDTLIDQSLDQLNKDNEQAREQRERQIEIMQSQLNYQKETGVFAREAETMLINAVNNASWDAIEDLLMKDEGFEYLSTFAQEQWLKDLGVSEKKATEGVENYLKGKYTTLEDAIKDLTTGINNAISNASSSSGGSGNGPGGTGPSSGPTNPSNNNDKLKAQVDAEYNNAMNHTGDAEGEARRQAERAADFAKARSDYTAIANNVTGSATERAEKIAGFLKNRINALNSKWGLRLNNTSVSSLSAYKTGGLADFTGPAWLDGTKSHPELVLNAKDTENFIALRNILSHLMNGQVGGTSAGTYGDINLDIDVNVDQISNDYDVDQLIDRIKQNIYQDASYRNIHQINFIR